MFIWYLCLFCLHFWKIALLHIGFLINSYFSLHFEYVIPLFSGFHCFWWEVSPSFGVSYKWWVVFLFLLQDFLLYLAFSIFTIISLFMDLFVFILLRICGLVFVNKLGNFLSITSLNIFSFSFFPSGIFIRYLLVCYPTFLWGCTHFSSFFFLSVFGLHNLYQSILKFVNIFSTRSWDPLVKFSCQLLYFSTSEFLFESFKTIYL